MNASSAMSASSANPRTRARAATVSVVPERANRWSRSRARGTTSRPTTPAITRKPTAHATVEPTEATVTDPPPTTSHHNGQDDQSDHVVGDGGAEDDARLGRRQGTEITEDPGRDADARGRQGGTEEDRRFERPARAPSAAVVAEYERHGDADDGDDQRRPPDPPELGQVHLHAHLHQEEEHADLGHHADAHGAIGAAQVDQPEHGWADHDAGGDLAQALPGSRPARPARRRAWRRRRRSAGRAAGAPDRRSRWRPARQRLPVISSSARARHCPDSIQPRRRTVTMASGPSTPPQPHQRGLAAPRAEVAQAGLGAQLVAPDDTALVCRQHGQHVQLPAVQLHAREPGTRGSSRHARERTSPTTVNGRLTPRAPRMRPSNANCPGSATAGAAALPGAAQVGRTIHRWSTCWR